MYWWVALSAMAAVLCLAVAWRRFLSVRRAVAERLARVEFEHHYAELEPAFLAAANATGKPRGLRWTKCHLQPDVVFARDKANGELYALAGATISFEAIEGGGMEDVEAVGNLRAGSAVFVFRNGRWTTDGRAVFNLEPAEAVKRYGESLEPIATNDDALPKAW